MIIVDRRRLRFLQAGRVITVDVQRRYKTGRDHDCGARAEHVVCRVHVLSCTRGERGYTLELKRAQPKPIYLAANPAAQRGDYTTNPARAARDETGAIEAVISTRRASEIYARDDELRRERAKERQKTRTSRYSAA